MCNKTRELNVGENVTNYIKNVEHEVLIPYYSATIEQ